VYSGKYGIWSWHCKRTYFCIQSYGTVLCIVWTHSSVLKADHEGKVLAVMVCVQTLTDIWSSYILEVWH
jgi:hypothetical protein